MPSRKQAPPSRRDRLDTFLDRAVRLLLFILVSILKAIGHYGLWLTLTGGIGLAIASLPRVLRFLGQVEASNPFGWPDAAMKVIFIVSMIVLFLTFVQLLIITSKQVIRVSRALSSVIEEWREKRRDKRLAQQVREVRELLEQPTPAP